MSIPCVRKEVITLADPTVGKWATLVSSRDRLIGDICGGTGILARAILLRAGETTRSRRSSLPYGLQDAMP